MDYVRRSYPGVDSYSFYLQAEYAGGPGRGNVVVDVARAQQIFGNIESAFAANDIAKEHAKDVAKILSTGKSLREKLAVIVKQPWKS